MTREAAIQKAVKLLRLAQSDNPAEAALAAARAQEILDRYEIDCAVLDEQGARADADGPIEDFGGKGAWLDEPNAKQRERWRTLLAAVIARANGCMVYNLGVKIGVIGRPCACDAVRYLFSYLAAEVNRLCARDGRGCGANWRNNYRLGVIDTLRAKLAEGAARTAQQARSDYAHNPAALVRVEQALVSRRVAYAEVSTWVERNMHMRTANWSSRPANWQAREAGRKAGHEITINAAKGALGGK